MENKTDLVTIEETTALQAFSQNGGLDSVIQQAKEVVSEFDHDLSTAAGRKRTASLANKVAKLKTRLDAMGKDLVSDWKAKSKAVDANRKAMRDELDALKVAARKPLTEWEEEQARIEAEEAARIEAENIANEINHDHEVAILMNEKFDREKAEKLAEEERQRIEVARIAEEQRKQREEEIRLNAIKEAEEKARIEAERVEREKLAAIARAEQAERDRIAAEERAKIEAEQAEIRRIEAEKAAKLHAEKMAEQARLAEIQRHKDELAKIEAEQAAREANKKHIGAIRKAAKESLMAQGLEEETAKKLVMAIHNGLIENVKINY